MHRPRISTIALLAPTIATAAVFIAACSGRSEEPILQQYFTASRLRDTQTLANFATVSFEPSQEGSVQSFTITNVSSEQKEPLHIKELAKAHEQAKAEADEFTKRKRAYQNENREAIDRVLKAEGQRGRLRGKDAEVQAAWAKWRDETNQYTKKVSEARMKLANERPIAELSVSDPRRGNLTDVTKYDGEMITKEVTLNAQVRQPNSGAVVPKTLLVTMQRAVLKGDDGKKIEGRWVITRLKDAGSGGAKTS
jgi:hypothetical protein